MDNIRHILPQITLHYGDLTADYDLAMVISTLKPDELYNMAAQSDVGKSFKCPQYTSQVTGLGVLNLLECVRRFCPACRVYQASSSEMFGTLNGAANEQTPMFPNSPYGAAKLMAHNLVRIYRASYGLYACAGICFNHESPRRGLDFVTRKVSHAVTMIKAGKQDKLELGNLNAIRDWGYAGDYVNAMWMMLQNDHPVDYVIGTGEAHDIRHLVYEAFDYVGLDWEKYVITSSDNLRPLDVPYLCADASKIRRELGWQPSIDFKTLVRMMVDSDLQGIDNV
jgi:GDPmannose 4,6-dehydratase